MDTKRLSDDLVIALIFRRDSVLYVGTGKKKNFPDFKLAHGSTDAAKAGHVKAFIHDQLGLTPSSVGLLGHIQKDPRDFMQYFINAHIYIYKVTVPADQFITPPPGAAEIGFHDLKAGQEEGFSYKARLMLDFLKDWTIPDFKRLDARDIRDWYNKWLGLHLKNAYKEYIEAEIDECHAEAECFDSEIGEAVKQCDETQKNLLADGAGVGAGQTATGAMGRDGPGSKLSALNAIKDHLCEKLHGLNSSGMNDWEKRLAYCLLGNLLKKTNALLDRCGSDGVNPDLGHDLDKLVSELESESLSPFEKRRG